MTDILFTLGPTSRTRSGDLATPGLAPSAPGASAPLLRPIPESDALPRQTWTLLPRTASPDCLPGSGPVHVRPGSVRLAVLPETAPKAPGSYPAPAQIDPVPGSDWSWSWDCSCCCVRILLLGLRLRLWRKLPERELQVVLGVRVVGVDSQRFLVCLDRLVVPTHLKGCVAPVEEPTRSQLTLRILERLVVLPHGFAELFHSIQCVSRVVERLGSARVALSGSFVLLQGRGVIPTQVWTMPGVIDVGGRLRAARNAKREAIREMRILRSRIRTLPGCPAQSLPKRQVKPVRQNLGQEERERAQKKE